MYKRQLESFVEKRFAAKGEKTVEGNIEAGRQGYKIGQHLAYAENIEIRLSRNAEIQKEMMLDGTEAISMGAIAGGCNFIASYPMSPSTGVLQFLAKESERFGIAVEQAEDEIAAINMGLGASFSGARALVTTSGGGPLSFAWDLDRDGAFDDGTGPTATATLTTAVNRTVRVRVTNSAGAFSICLLYTSRCV